MSRAIFYTVVPLQIIVFDTNLNIVRTHVIEHSLDTDGTETDNCCQLHPYNASRGFALYRKVQSNSSLLINVVDLYKKIEELAFSIEQFSDFHLHFSVNFL